MKHSGFSSIRDSSCVDWERRPDVVLTPSEAALHNNLLVSLEGLRKGVVRTAYFLAQVRERRVHRKLGYRSLAAYAARYGGLTARQTEEFVVLGRRLPSYPEVERSLNQGRLSWSQARLIVRRAPPEQQREWVEKARSMTSRELQRALPPIQSVARQEMAESDDSIPGPCAAPDPLASPSASVPVSRTSSVGPVPQKMSDVKPPSAPSTIHVTLSFTGEEYGMFELMLAKAQAGRMERKILDALAGSVGGGSATGYLLVVLQCPECGRGVIPTSRGEVEADKALLGAARCHGVIEADDLRRRRAVSSRLRRLALRRARYRCEADGCLHTQYLEIHHRVPVSAGGGGELSDLVVLCSGCHRRLHQDEQQARQSLDATL